ncbi:MAG: tandem-95 repeat protein [Pirellulaceae bacterium]|nr:tandem-95 repeat protein [Pirellulaceae bacterium]
MRSLGHLLGQVRNRVSHQKKRPSNVASASRFSAFSASFEPLEQRRLLAANILASLDGGLLTAGDTSQIQLDVAGASAVIGFRMCGTGGTLDPDTIVIRDLSGHTIAPVMAYSDVNGTDDSLVLAELSPGSYTITTRAEGLTTGTYHLDAFLPGDRSGDGIVDQNELRWAEAATIQSTGSWNFITQQYYASHGIDLTTDLYRDDFDCDLNGRINNIDLSAVAKNASGSQVTIEMVGDSAAPVIQAALRNDTGISGSDGISRDVTIEGTVTDASQIIAFEAGIDGMDRSEYVSLLGHLDAAGAFVLDLTQLEAIAGAPLANNGPHSLFLIAADEHGNESNPLVVAFELDTVAPTAPTGLDLIAASDLGLFNNDNVTSDNTPTFAAVAEAGARFTLYYRLDGSGDPIPVSNLAAVPITASLIPDGTHEFIITATDAAGNVSGHSAPLSVTIDTVAPQVPTLDLAAADDTGAVGDQYTAKTNVTLEGVAEAGSRLTLNGTTVTQADATTGAYHFAGVPLAFDANSFTVVSMDLAGNTRGFTQSIVQNNAPTLGAALDPINVNEDPGTVTRSLATLFADPNLTAGDVLTLSIVGNTNPTLVTPSLSGTSGQVVNSQLNLQFGANRHGSAVLTIRATDSRGETVQAEVVVNVAPVNDPPVLVGTGILNCDENSFIQIDLREQFTDVETPAGELIFALVPDSAELGVAEMLSDGHTIRFTANLDTNGLGRFKVTVTDTGDAGTPAKTIEQIFFVNIAAINDPPRAEDGYVTTNEEETVIVDLWSLVDDTETPVSELTFTVGEAQHGTVTLVGGRHAHFTPTPDYSGPASFNYTVTDTGDGEEPPETSGATVFVTVAPINDAPVANTFAATIAENQPLEVNLRDLVSDKETADASLAFAINSMTGGTAVLHDGYRVVFTPMANYNGPAGFTYSVTDLKVGDEPGQGAITVGPVAVTITITPVNSAPVAQATTVTTPEEVTTAEINLRALVSDVETPVENLTFRVGNAQNGTVVLTDGYKAFFTPAQDFNGQTTFTYWVKDAGDNGAAAIETGPITITVTVTPVNDAPVANTFAATIAENQPLEVNLRDLVSDKETADASLTFAINSMTGGMAVLHDGYRVVFTPTTNYNGPAGFTYSVTDLKVGDGPGQGAITVGPVAVTITINPINSPPVAQTTTVTTLEDVTTAEINLRALVSDVETPVENLTFRVGNAQNGQVVLTDGYKAFFTPAANFNGQASFTYWVKDAGDNGAAAIETGPITITVNVTPVNDAPVAVANAYAVAVDGDLNVSAALGVLTNDTDVDGDLLTAVLVQTTQHGTLTLNPNGSFTYLPGAGFEGVDTFTYRAFDGNLQSNLATVTITVSGANQAPEVDNPIADLVLTDSSSPKTTVIDLNAVFSDPDGDALTYTAASSNTSLVTVAVNGNLLSVTYVNYGTAQNRTPADITVTAKDPSNESAADTFVVTVNPEETIGVFVVIRDTATPSGSTTAAALPSSITQVDVGSSYVVEIWIQDTYNATVTGGPSQGISASQIDVAFNKALSSGTALGYEGAFFSGGVFDSGVIDNAAGLVDNFGAGTLVAGLAVSPNYSRVGYVTFDASAAGVQVFNLSNPVVARYASGEVHGSQIELHGASVNQVTQEPVAFVITDQDLRVSGVINGATLTPTPAPAFRAEGVVGQINVLADNLDDPTKIKITGGTADVTPNFAIGPVWPGIGGVDPATWGDFAFQADVGVGNLIELAIRDLILDFSSDWISLSGGLQFEPDEIVIGCDTGYLDMLSPVTGGERVTLTGITAVPSGVPQTGILWGPDELFEDIYELTINYDRIIDLTGLTSSISAGSYLKISGVITATYDPNGAPLVGSESAPIEEVGTGVYMTLAKEPTLVAAGGQLATLPRNEAWLHEWDSYWVEVWVATDQLDGVGSAKVDLLYNSEYFTATQIDHAGTFNQAVTGNLKTDGVVDGLGGSTALAGMGADGYVLLGRVKFESIGDDGIDINLDDLVLGPHDLGLVLANASVQVGGQDVADVTVGRSPKTELWAVPFDVDNNGLIGPGDLSFFAAAYGGQTLDSASPFVHAFDFDNNGLIGPGDLSFFAGNYGAARGGEKDVVLPESFVQRYIGAGLQVQGESSVGQILDAAVASWTDALGVGEPITIQLVVKDFGSNQLAEAVILEVNEYGVPTSGRIMIDDDANGLGWHSDLNATPAESQYDLYTVLLHEIGHTLGFTTSYHAFASHLDASGDSTVFEAAAISVEMDRPGNHVAVDLVTGESLDGDLMSKTLAPGVRKAISTLDVRMMHAAYQTAGSGVTGYSGVGAALTGLLESTPETLATSMSTVEISPLQGELVGDATWDRLLSRPLGVDLAKPVEAAFADTLFAAVDPIHETTRDGQAAEDFGGVAADRRFGDESFDWADWAGNRTSSSTEEVPADAFLADWDDWRA